MLKDLLSFKNNYFYLSLFIIFIFFLYASNSYRFIYDGHHHGLVFSNALDILNGKKPYKEIFIQYGLITTFLHSLVIKIFGHKIIYINIFTSLIYSLSIILFYLIVDKLTNKKFAFFTVLILLFNHPIVWLPWSNYISFFFIIFSVFYLVRTKKDNNFISGIFLALCCLSRQDFFIPIFFSLLIFIFMHFYFNKKFLHRIILGFIFPLLLFFMYLIFNDLLVDWSKTLYLPSLYVEDRGTSLLTLLNNFLIFLFFDSFFNFINHPQNLIISVIFLINLFLLYFFFISRKIRYFYLSFLSLSLCLTSINFETFRLYTSISLGLIPTIYFIYKYKKNEYVKALLYGFILVSFFSIIFYPKGNNDLFYKDLNTLKKTNISILKYVYLPKQTASSFKKIVKIKNNIDKNCLITYGENFTFDTMIISLLNYNRIYYFPYVKSDTKSSKIMSFFDIKFIGKINNQIKEEKIILITEENNTIFTFGKINFGNNYTYTKININPINDKPKYLKFYYPKKCLPKS